MEATKEIITGIAVLSGCIILLAQGPWGSDVLGFFFSAETRNTITTVATVTLIPSLLFVAITKLK